MSQYYIDDFKLNTSRGLVKGASVVHKFGAVPSMSTATTGTVWDKNDTLYPWSAFSVANTISVSANAADNGVAVTIYGLDSNYAEINETVTIASGAATTTNSFLRVYRAFASAPNANNISMNINGTEVARITAGMAQTLMAVYTVPAGKTAYLYKGACSAQASADATGNMYVRYFGQTSFRVGHSFEVAGAGGPYVYDFAYPIAIPAKSDIDVRVTTRSNNGRYTAAFDMLLVDTPIQG